MSEGHRNHQHQRTISDGDDNNDKYCSVDDDLVLLEDDDDDDERNGSDDDNDDNSDSNGWIECLCLATFDLELGQSCVSFSPLFKIPLNEMHCIATHSRLIVPSYLI